MSWLSRLANVLRRDRVSDDLDEELRFHVEARAEALRKEGQPADQAAIAAQRGIGDRMRLREASLDIKLLPWLDALARDVALGLRMLRKHTAVSASAVASLALAIGACIAAFSLIDALILRPLPVRQPSELIHLAAGPMAAGAPEVTSLQYPLFERLSAAVTERADLALMSYQSREPVVLPDGSGEGIRASTQYVSGNAFDLLGIVPAHGRLLTASDDRTAGAHPVAVVSHAFWSRQLGADRDAVGRWMTIAERPFQIVGVTRPGFTGVEPGTLTDIWLPAKMFLPAEALTDAGYRWAAIWGRLRAGVQAESLRARMQPVFTAFQMEQAARFRSDAPDRRERFVRAPLHVRAAAHGLSRIRQQFERPLWVLAALVALVLLIACSNLANLLLARAASRQREMALRVSLGAGRRRLVQQLLVESGLIAATAALLGLAFARLSAPLIVQMLAPAGSPVYLDLRIDGRVLGFAASIGTLTALLFGLVPALRASSTSPADVLKATGARAGMRTGLMRPLVAAQVGFSLAVLFLAGLLLASFDRLTNTNAGFTSDGVILVSLEPARGSDPRLARAAAYEMLDHIRQLPDVHAASLSGWPLLTGTGWTMNVRVPGHPPDDVEVHFLPVSPGFLQTMGIALRQGRDLQDHAADRAPTIAAVVNEAFVKRYFSGERPIGGIFGMAVGQSLVQHRIVGVMADAKYNDLREAPPPTVYVHFDELDSATMAIRSSGPHAPLVAAVREAAQSLQPAFKVMSVTTQSTIVADTVLRERLLAALSGFFAVVSLALAAIGLYGVMSYSVVQRTREIGIRLALGARQRVVVAQVLRGIALHTALGIAGGLAGGLYLARFVTTMLYEAEPMDPASILAPVAALLAVGVVAALVPARRAASVDPVVALRED